METELQKSVTISASFAILYSNIEQWRALSQGKLEIQSKHVC